MGSAADGHARAVAGDAGLRSRHRSVAPADRAAARSPPCARPRDKRLLKGWRLWEFATMPLIEFREHVGIPAFTPTEHARLLADDGLLEV
jgi:hypothetical protein